MLVTWWLMFVTGGYYCLSLVTARSHFQYKGNKAHNFVQRIVRARGMYVAHMKPVQVVWENLCPIFSLSDKWYVRQMKLFNFMNCQIVGRETSCMDLFIRHQIRHTKCDIKDFMKMVDEFRTKNMAQNIDYSWKIISILYRYICLEQSKASN